MKSTTSKLGSSYLRGVLGAAVAVALLAGAWWISHGGDVAQPRASTAQSAARPGAAESLQVTISGVRSDAGSIIGTLCREGERFVSACTLHARAQAAEGLVTLNFEGLSAGDYALAVFHDENANSRLELGAEGIGFSNNTNLAHAPPQFDASRISVQGLTRIRVRLRYSL